MCIKGATMDRINALLRLEEPRDYSEVEHLVREAFWNVYQPGCDEHYLLHLLRDSAGYILEMHFVAVYEGQIIGSIVYSRSRVVDDDGLEWQALTFGPLSVLPEYQRKGIGSALIRHTVSLAEQNGERAIIIFGNPAYYAASASGLRVILVLRCRMATRSMRFRPWSYALGVLAACAENSTPMKSSRNLTRIK
jgi:predicted N-acetyltransferase YhbS